MRKFIGREVQVELGGEPRVVVDRETRWEVASVERWRFDTGHGATSPRARTWRTRRHRKVYLLAAANGERLTVYMDYAREDRKVWQLVTVETAAKQTQLDEI